MLLKAFIRLLDGRTQQRWLFKPQQDNHEQQAADLVFLGDEGAEPEAAPGNAQAPRQLRMGVLALDLYARLDRPLRPDELEREMNRMGALLVQSRADPLAAEVLDRYTSGLGHENVGDGQHSALWRPVAEGSGHAAFAPTTGFVNEFIGTVPATLQEKALTAAAPPAQMGSPEAPLSVALHDQLRMLRWPHASMISAPPRLKLAAFMAGKGTTLSDLQKNSGQSLQACKEFVQDLHASGFLSIATASPTSTPGASGLQAVPKLADSAVVAKPEALKAVREPPALPGLFARIRARLGMPVAS